MLLLCATTHALEFRAFKSSKSSTSRDYTVAEFDKIWATKLACVKRGSKVLTSSDAFNKMGLKYLDCSSSGANVKLNAKRGIEVIVIKLSDLPTKYVKQLSK